MVIEIKLSILVSIILSAPLVDLLLILDILKASCYYRYDKCLSRSCRFNRLFSIFVYSPGYGKMSGFIARLSHYPKQFSLMFGGNWTGGLPVTLVHVIHATVLISHSRYNCSPAPCLQIIAI